MFSEVHQKKQCCCLLFPGCLIIKTRLPRGLYDEVLRRVEGRIEKKDTWYRKSLPPSLKLSITLRHLACGDNYTSTLSHDGKANSKK
jgi:hypothetical protein